MAPSLSSQENSPAFYEWWGSDLHCRAAIFVFVYSAVFDIHFVAVYFYCVAATRALALSLSLSLHIPTFLECGEKSTFYIYHFVVFPRFNPDSKTFTVNVFTSTIKQISLSQTIHCKHKIENINSSIIYLFYETLWHVLIYVVI